MLEYWNKSNCIRQKEKDEDKEGKYIVPESFTLVKNTKQ